MFAAVFNFLDMQHSTSRLNSSSYVLYVITPVFVSQVKKQERLWTKDLKIDKTTHNPS